MKVLWIATKPPVPPVDGGRLAALETLRSLREADAEVTLVAPVGDGEDAESLTAELAAVCRPRLVPARRLSTLEPLAATFLGRPFTIARHRRPEVAAEVERLLDTEPFDVVHCEQLQAFPQAAPALRRGVPVVLRAQNVESDLWSGAARHAGLAAPWLLWQARRLARYEAAAVRTAAATVALTRRDADRLEALAGGDRRVKVIPPPFPTVLPPAERELPGDPPLVLLGSGGWLPNRDAVRWFTKEIWPAVRGRVPKARLHLYVSAPDRFEGDGIATHPPPADSRDAFAPNSILVVPLRTASGIRMKILEAWARGVPVIATPTAAAGLEARAENGLILAKNRGRFCDAVARLGADADSAAHLVATGRATLSARFDSGKVAEGLLQIYSAARSPGLQ